MKPAFNVKSAHLDALSIQLTSHQIADIRETLHNQIDKYLKFKALPFILDAQQIEDGESVPFADILALFKEHQLNIVGLRHSNPEWGQYATAHHLIFLPIVEKNATSSEQDDAELPESDTTTDAPHAEAPKINTQTLPETPPTSSENNHTVESDADAFARELFGEAENETPSPETTPEIATESDENDILANDNDAIKTVEMAKQADLVELSPEEAQKLAESIDPPSELNSEEGEAKGEIVSISEAKQTIVVSTPVRTGQQIYAEKADLIVLGIVSPGAEVIADGNIHIYAPLRGRALAGASGDRKARIFVQSMQAELVSIAGIYRTFEQKLPAHLAKKPVRIELQEDRLAISSIVAE